MVFAQRDEARAENYAYAQEQARSGLDSIVTQVRQAWSILSTTPNAVEMDVNLGGVSRQVYYQCDLSQPGSPYRECVRLESAVGASLPPLSSGRIVVRNLMNGTATDPVFSFAPDPIAPYYMTATIDLPANDGETGSIGALTHPIVFSSGALMRNLNVGN
jgi:hypothetical protein